MTTGKFTRAEAPFGDITMFERLRYLSLALVLVAGAGRCALAQDVGNDEAKTSRGDFFQALRQVRGALLAGDEARARKLVAEARAWANKRQDKLALAWVEQLTGEIEFSADPGKAAAAFSAALSLFTDLNNLAALANCHLNLGRLALAKNQPAAALEHHDQALKLLAKLKRPADTAAVLRDQGTAYKALKKPDEALAAWQKALEICRADPPQPAAELQVLADLATCRLEAGAEAEALKDYLAAVALAGKLQDTALEAHLRGRLGLLYQQQGKLDEARKQYETALRIQAKNPKEQAAEAQNRNNLAALLHEQGDAPAALQEYARALKILTSLNDKAGQARTYYNMALVHESQGRDALALEAYDKALELRSQLADYPGMVRILDNQALLFAAQGKSDKAKECKERADKLRMRK